MTSEPSFTETVRQELARLPFTTGDEVADELASIVRLAGSVTLTGDDPRVRLTVETTSGAVARRTHGLVVHLFDLAPELRVRAPAGMRTSSSYAVGIAQGAAHVARELGVLDRGGRLIPPRSPSTRAADVAWLRGAVLVATSISAPGRPAHLEIVTRSAALADLLADALRRRLDATASVSAVPRDPERHRVIIKSGAAIGELLVLVGATSAFLVWDERRLRRQLRNDANRLANADAANLRRSIEAASSQLRAVEAAIERVGWDVLDAEVREAALARLANPEASLAELGALLDPPVGKSTIRRRLQRLVDLATRDRDTLSP